jgi:hypothetical protein
MAELQQPCCAEAQQGFIERLTKSIASYPVIKNVPCPTCQRIIEIRIYARPQASDAAAE